MNFNEDLKNNLKSEEMQNIFLCEGWKIEVGMQIARVRKEQHLTQKELASILGLSQAAIAKFESGMNLTCDTLWKLGYALKTDIVLFGASAEKERSQFQEFIGGENPLLLEQPRGRLIKK